MRHRRPALPRLAVTLLLAAVPAAAGSASATSSSDRTPGTLEGSIGADTLSLEGVCSIDDGSFSFWSDGTEFSVNRDTDGDGVYLNILILTIGERTSANLLYGRDGERRYGGTFEFSAFDGRSLSVETEMGRDQLPAAFEVRCADPDPGTP